MPKLKVICSCLKKERTLGAGRPLRVLSLLDLKPNKKKKGKTLITSKHTGIYIMATPADGSRSQQRKMLVFWTTFSISVRDI